MKFNVLGILGVLLIVAGLAALAYPEIKLPAKKEEVQIGPVTLPMETRRVIDVPPVAAGIVIVMGAGLIFFGARKS